MPWGRGGAGNIAAAEEAKARAAEDIEAARAKPTANTPSSPSSNPTPDPMSEAQTEHSQTQPQEYAHMGRGGAGNWFSPKELDSTGTFATPTDSSVPIKAQKATSGEEIVSETRHRGRGGAGNFIWSQEDEERARRETEDKEIELKEIVAKNVEEGLQKPGRAWLDRERGEWQEERLQRV